MKGFRIPLKNLRDYSLSFFLVFLGVFALLAAARAAVDPSGEALAVKFETLRVFAAAVLAV